MRLTDPFSGGHIYVLTNQSCPGMVKIGMTSRDVEERIEEINRQSGTGLPTPWQLEYSAATPHYQQAEKRLHKYFAKYRVNKGREFFKIPPASAISAINEMLGIPTDNLGRAIPPEDVIFSEESDVIQAWKRLGKELPSITLITLWDSIDATFRFYKFTPMADGNWIRLVLASGVGIFVGNASLDWVGFIAFSAAYFFAPLKKPFHQVFQRREPKSSVQNSEA